MKMILSALFVSAFIASPAMACNWMKSAESKSTYTASIEEKSEEAISTFDPTEKPIFEEDAGKADSEELVEKKPAE